MMFLVNLEESADELPLIQHVQIIVLRCRLLRGQLPDILFTSAALITKGFASLQTFKNIIY